MDVTDVRLSSADSSDRELVRMPVKAIGIG